MKYIDYYNDHELLKDIYDKLGKQTMTKLRTKKGTSTTMKPPPLEITIGTDPEVFIVDKEGKFYSGHQCIPGTKELPFKVPYGAIQVDGVALEFNTDPARTAGEFVYNIASVMDTLDTYVTAYSKVLGKELSIRATPTAYFEKGYFSSLPDIVKVLGCTPDFNAYTLLENEPPSTTESFRTGSGHIHVGWDSFLDPSDSKHVEFCAGLVKDLDVTLFAASLFWDDDVKRRELYGKLGAFRPKPYGLEYRSMSNAYLNDVEIQSWVFKTAKAISHKYVNEGFSLYRDTIQGKSVLEIIQEIEAGSNEPKYYSWLKENLDYFTNYGVPNYRNIF